jgi:hypothetical protein
LAIFDKVTFLFKSIIGKDGGNGKNNGDDKESGSRGKESGSRGKKPNAIDTLAAIALAQLTKTPAGTAAKSSTETDAKSFPGTASKNGSTLPQRRMSQTMPQPMQTPVPPTTPHRPVVPIPAAAAGVVANQAIATRFPLPVRPSIRAICENGVCKQDDTRDKT